MIQVERLTKKFQTYTALNQISVSVQPGSVFGLVGSNGAGKSTLLRTIVVFINRTAVRLPLTVLLFLNIPM